MSLPVDISDHEFDFTVSGPAGSLSVPYIGLSYEDDPNEVGMKVRLQVPDQATDDWDPSSVAIGTSFVLSGGPPASPVEICRGTILGLGFGLLEGEPIQPRGFSMLYALLKSRIDCHYDEGQTGTDIMFDLCNQWNIPMDRLDGPSVVVAPLTGRRKQIADIFTEILKRGKAQGDSPYVMKWTANGFACVKPGSNPNVYLFTDNDSVLGGSLDSSAESLVTRVKVYAPVDDASNTTTQRDAKGRFVASPTKPAIKPAQELVSVDGHTEFGIFQDVIYAKKDTDEAAGTAQAQALLATNGQPTTTIDLEVPLLADVAKGDRHHVVAGPLDTYGYVLGLAADIGARTMRLTMSLTWTDSFSTSDTDSMDDSGSLENQADDSPNSAANFNPDTPAVVQTNGWTCSCASAAWMLQSMGIQASADDVVTALHGGVNSDQGLLDGSGSGLASALKNTFGVAATSSPITFDEALSIAGKQPLQCGSSAWDHWTGVSGADGDTLQLANPAPNYGGTTMTRAQWNARAPWYAVRIDPNAVNS